MVNKPALYDVNKLVVAAWISRKNEEAWVNQIADGVEDDSFHHFSVEKLKPHPDAVNDGCSRMKIEMIANRIAFKAVDVKNRLDVFDGDLFDFFRIDTAYSKYFRRSLRSATE